MALFSTGVEQISLANATVYGQGDGLVMGVREGSICTGDKRVTVRNRTFVGGTDYFHSTDFTHSCHMGEERNALKLD